MPRPTLRSSVARLGLLLGAVALTSCAAEAGFTPQALPPVVSETIPPYAADADVSPGRTALTLVPADAETITITDFDASRAALGMPDLTSQDPMSDRSDYWERARRETVLLTEGMLRADNSRLALDYGFTQDDVDWEARFTTPEGAGWILGFRPDLDLAPVRRAIEDRVAGLAGAEVDAGRNLVSVGAVAEDEESWADHEGIFELTAEAPAESTYYRAGCVPLGSALGPDAGVQDQDAVLAGQDPTDLDPLARFALSFDDGLATARLGPGRLDLFERADLAKAFPEVGPLGFGDALVDPVADPSTGRIGYTVRESVAAASVALTDLLPFAVCNEVTPMEEPTGL
ncbi:hypothetical protein [Nocardioides piscis]|uniref:Lipoprotein n=1 Tax=Nocardioides piscis TaxID=2714938 RepID=A0A6G7YDZ9_9ACTN|nr:hypothetical protein [Nocardioides piscis]QIK74906.1 hypothetical protein G7071_05155 [Nocardioides piscis]